MEDKMLTGTVWLCAHGHILGIMRRVEVGQRRFDALYKLRHARIGDCGVDTVSVPADAIDCRIEGTTHDIRCDIPGCGASRTWWQGQQSLDRLLTKYKLKIDTN